MDTKQRVMSYSPIHPNSDFRLIVDFTISSLGFVTMKIDVANLNFELQTTDYYVGKDVAVNYFDFVFQQLEQVHINIIVE